VVPLDEQQAAALEAELRAIERELDKLDLPSDQDFEGIESELP
jgi:ABC-type Zn uptake system ZnuABC Zn-binding protein ZnuA